MYICPKTGVSLKLVGSFYETHNGSIRYPIIDGIPLLLIDYAEHLNKINKIKKSNKGSWYSSDQLDYYDHGPYRYQTARRRRFVQQTIQNFLADWQQTETDGPVIVDLGCGDGGSTRWIVDECPEDTSFFLTDYNYDRLIRARELFGIHQKFNYFLSDIDHPPIPDNSCDLVFSHHVIEHVYDDNSIFKTSFKTLKPGGLFVLGCPNEGVFWWMLAYALTPFSIRNSDHIHFYNPELLIKMAKEHGFIHQKTELMGYGVPHWGLDARLRQYKWIDDLFHFVGTYWTD